MRVDRRDNRLQRPGLRRGDQREPRNVLVGRRAIDVHRIRAELGTHVLRRIEHRVQFQYAQRTLDSAGKAERAMNALGADPSDCLFVGDSPADMEAGKRAGVKTCAVRYGYGKQEKLAGHSPDYWISDLRELVG